MKKLFFLASALLCGAISASAVDYLVQTGKTGDPAWTDAAITKIKENSPNVKLISFDTLQIANLPTTGEFWFAAGTYDFEASYDMKANTKLIGGFAGTETYASAPKKQNNKPYDYVNPTILNVVQPTGDKATPIRLFKNDAQSGVVLTGLTIQNSKQTGNGGVYKPLKGNQIKYCTFKNNSATGQGGALLLYGQEVTIEGCLFEGNTAQQGGAVYCAGDNAKELKNCDFIGNSISGNTGSTHTGGAIYKQNNGNLTVSGCYFEANNSPLNGSAIALTGLNTTLVNNVVYDNKTKIAIYAFNLADVKFYYNTIVANEQGGLYTSSSKSGAVSIDLKNNVFWGTTTTGKCAVANAKGSMENNAFVQNMSGSDTLSVATNNIKLETANTGSEEGKLYPVFADPENGDFNLGKGSALIGKGVAIEGITTDIKGVTRTSLDLGAYAYVDKGPGTAIENTEKAPIDIQAALQAGEVFNLLGQRVGELQAGNIYIVGGQKVLMR